MAEHVGVFTVMRYLYDWLMVMMQPLLRRKLLRRSVLEPGYAMALEERFGRYTRLAPQADGRTIWIHAVSLGETRAAAELVAALRQKIPMTRLLLTHGTATGYAEGAKIVHSTDCQTWLPWDSNAAVDGFLNHFKPAIGILMETEIWPNLISACQRRQLPLVLVNARMSDKSMRQAQILGWLARPAFAALTAVWAQTEADAQRLRLLGARVKGVFGNLKFDATPHADQIAAGKLLRSRLTRPVVMLASSRAGEELALLQILKAFRPAALDGQAFAATDSIVDQVQWLIVPRHPQRFDEVADLIKSHGFAVSRRSDWGADLAVPSPQVKPTLWLGDSLGEMAWYYSLADVALLGGSFEPLGGQNLIEAAACACPVVMGPHTFNFAQAAEMAQEAGAAQRVDNLAQAVRVAHGLALNPTAQNVMADAAGKFASRNRGAVGQTAQAVVELFDQQGVDGG